MTRLTVLCFAGTYALALLSELARFAIRGVGRWYLALGLTCLALIVHTIYLANLALHHRELPVTSLRESLLVLSWIMAAIDVYLVLRAPKTVAVGLFTLPVILALAVFGGLASSTDGLGEWHGWVSFWGAVHGLFLMAGAVATCVAFVAGLMFLAQASRLKHKRPPRFGVTLPSLEQSERLNRGAITVAFPMLSFGFLIGVALILATRTSDSGALGWSDPKVISGFLLWLFFAVLLNARYRPALRGRGVMLLTVLAFAFLVFTWVGVGVLLPTEHGVPHPAGRAR